MDPYPTDAIFFSTTRSSTSVIEFSPLLSLQRYVTVLQVIKDFQKRQQVNTVTEFGCGSFVFFDKYLVKCDFIKLVHQIDVDRSRLLGALHMIETNQYMKRSDNPDREPLTVNIFEGNLAKVDCRTIPCDVVVAIEVIEHLYEEDLMMFPSTVFQFSKPKLVIITTPNYDYNILFKNGCQFRNEDHKFEFTKSQFINWANEIVTKYPNYHVKFFGIGDLPKGCSRDIGYCTQMAVFEKYQDVNIPETDLLQYSYNLLGTYSYFTCKDQRTEEEKILDDVDQIVIRYIIDDENLLYIDTDCEWHHRMICLPVELLVKNCRFNLNETRLISVMSNFESRYRIKFFKNYGNVLVTTDECEINNCYDC